MFRQAIRAAAVLAALPGLGHAEATPHLHGVVYLASAAALQPAGIPLSRLPKTCIAAAGLPFLQTPGFAAEIAPLLGAPISLENLAALQRDAQLSYVSHGHPFVDVTLPPQNISSGIVQIIVTEYHVGAVTVTGNRWFAAPIIIRESGLASGDDLALDPLRDDLAFLNQNPFRTVSLVFAPGDATGATNVELHVTDRLPLHIYAGFDNQGFENLGRDEATAGLTWGNAFGQDQILSYQFTRTTLNRYTAHGLNWTIPLPGHDKILLFGAYATERPQISSVFNETGHSLQASFRYILALPDAEPAPKIRLTADIQLGYDYKTANNNLAFGGVDVFASAAAIDQFPLIVDLSQTDRFGQTQLSNMLVASPGGLTGGNKKSAFNLNEPGASPRYLYDNAALTRVTFLPAGLSLTSRLLAQAANTNLLYSEQLGLGGAASLPGYITDTALGSDGILLGQELRAPAFSLSHLLHMTLPDTEQLGAFWDSGHVSQVHLTYGTPANADLASAGLDLHASLGPGASLSFDIGWQLRPPPGTAKRGAFTDLSIVIGY